MGLTTLNLSHNLFPGHIPKEIGEYLPSLISLNLSRNAFDGSIPSSIGDMNLSESLDLSFNQLSGKIPEHLAKGCTSLQLLVLSNNSIQGPIPLEFCRLNNHEVLDLIGNSISGSLPSCFSPPSITQVHLSKNRLPHLTYLTLSNNNFEGEVPTQLCKLKQLRLADISHNNLYGHFHPCLDVTALHDSDHDIVSPSSISMPPVGTISMPTTEGPNSGPPIRKEDTVEFRIKYKAYSGPPMGKEETVEFRTKNNSYFYQGKVLTGKLELISRAIN
ncbi:hypothetical protein QYF36_024941 [Acer negundo]|nr:hypothetical protein QYF36_024941 [Acer negundo]